MRKLLWAGVTAGSGMLLALAILGAVDHWTVVRFLPSRTFDEPSTHRIGILGDSQKGLANLRNITRRVMSEKVDLLLHTGDLVSRGDEGHYRLAALYLARGGARGMPPVAPGNHDLDGGAHHFWTWCGSNEERTLRHGEVAVVLLNNAFGAPPDPKHVEERIFTAGPHKTVVLLMHRPPFDLQGQPKPEYAAFLKWLETSQVAYLLCGHVHTYMRKKVGETTVIINGVGGDYDSWQLQQKVYATILDIDGTAITDRRIEIEPAHEVWENVEHLAIGHVAEAYRQRPVLSWGATLLLAAGLGWGWVRLLRRPRIPKPA